MSSEHSNDLVWALTKKNNSYLVKRRANGGFEFSRDPLNPSGRNCATYTGLANNKAVGVYVCPESDRIVLSTKSQKNHNKPAKSKVNSVFKKHITGRRAALAVAKATEGYRNDLRQIAVVKASALARAANKPAKEQKKTNSRR